MNETITVQVNADTQQFDSGIGGVVNRLGGAGPLAIAGAAAAAAAAIGKFTADSVRFVAEVEDSMRQFQVETGATQEQADAFGESIRELYRNNTDTLNDLTDAATTVTERWGSLGEKTDETTQKFLDFSKVTNQDASTAIDGVTNVLLAFGEPLESAGGLMDALAAASQATGAPMGTLQTALAESAPLLESLNMSMEEGIAFLANMEANGVGADTAVRGLRNIIERSVEPTESQAAALETLGVNLEGVSDPNEKARSTLDQLMGLMGKGALSADEMAAAVEIMGSRAGVDMVRAMQDGGAGVDELMGVITTSEGTVTDASATYDKQLGERWTLIQRNYLEPFMTFVGTGLIGGLESLLTFVEEMGPGITAAFETMRATLETIWNAVLTLIQGVLNTMKSDNEVTTSELQGLWEAFKGTLTALFDALVGLYNNVLKPAWDAMTPWLDALTSSLGTLIDGLVGTWTDAFNMFAAFLSGDFTGAWEAFKSMVTGIRDTLATVVQTLVDGWRGSFDSIKSYFEGVFKRAMESAASAIETAFNNLRDRASNAMETLFNGLGGLARGGLEGIHSAFEWLSGAVQTSWSAMTSAIQTLAQALRTKVQEAFGEAADWLTEKMNVVIDAINNGIERLNSALEINIPDINFTIPENTPFIGGQGINITTPDINPPDIDPIPRLAEGGIVDQATLAIIGEAGPEAVVPLDRLGSMTGNQTIIVELDGRRIAESTVRHAPSVLRLHGV